MADLQTKIVGKLRELTEQFDAIERQLLDPQVGADHERVRGLSVKRAALADMVGLYREYQACQRQIDGHKRIISDNADPDLVSLAREELPELERTAAGLLTRVADEMVSAEDRSVGSVILEVRAGTGGAEAALWAGDLYEMFRRYASRKGWAMSTMDLSPGDQGGIRSVIASVQGPGVWQGLGYEAGVHCVKRVPATETQGRIHTSTATVAVLPEPEKVQMDIPESEVKMDITTSQGPGGQNVNKVATAVHLIHLPTGIEVRMQESKSQQQNRQKAWQLLRARVYDHYQRLKDAQRAQTRSQMIGGAERSERIRTYRYKENIAVDHRLTGSFNLQELLAGNLDPLVEALTAQDHAQRLAAI